MADVLKQDNYDALDAVDIAIAVDKRLSNYDDLNTSIYTSSQELSPEEFYNTAIRENGELGGDTDVDDGYDDIEYPEDDGTEPQDIDADETYNAKYSDDEDIIDMVAGI